jgi:hypothetical protein
MRPTGLSGFLRPFGIQVARGMGRVQNAQQEQTLVILLQTVLSHLLHDEIPNLRQGSGSVLRQQLLQACQAKFFISGVGYFRYAIGNHQEEIAR